MRHSQRGITFIGWLILLTPFGDRRLRRHPPGAGVPELHEGVEGAVARGLGGQERLGGISPLMLRTSIEKNFEIESIEHPATKDIEIHREGDHWSSSPITRMSRRCSATSRCWSQFHKQVEMQ